MILSHTMGALCAAISEGSATRYALVDTNGTVWRFTEAAGFEDISVAYTGPERREVQRDA